jgi:hypothetical protein
VTLESPHLQKPLDATPENIAEVIAPLPHQKEGDRFTVLGKDSQTYAQTLSTAVGSQLEYQEGSIAEHYHCTRKIYQPPKLSRYSVTISLVTFFGSAVSRLSVATSETHYFGLDFG